MFATNAELTEHHLATHGGAQETPKSVSGKRKFVSEDVTPIIEPMPDYIAKRRRPVYEGVSRSLNIGVGGKRGKK